MTRVVATCLLVLLPSLAAADDDHRGWRYLVDRLIADGVPRERVVAIFDDPRLEPFTGLEFGPISASRGYADARGEAASLYRRFRRPSSIAAARRCRAENAGALEEGERIHGVPASLVAAILYVETGCGRNTGSSPVFYRLARLAMANEPANVRANIARLGRCSDEALELRARYLDDVFYPEVKAAFEAADRMGVNPLALRGSASGAIGFPQFLPTSYLRYGTDGDGDGHVDLFDARDAAVSCAGYLTAHGWRTGLSLAAQRDVIWAYNHSRAYVDTVLFLTSAVARRVPTQQVDAPSGGQRVAAVAAPHRASGSARTRACLGRPGPARRHVTRRT